MTEELQSAAAETASPPRAQTPGELLRHERERLGRSVQEFAEEMHLGVHMIEAMEANKFSVLGAPVFARGHLRKYASLLGVSVERIQQLYEAVADRPSEPDPVPAIHRAVEPIAMSPGRERRIELQPAQWALIVAGGALLSVVLIVWMFVGGSNKPAPAPQTAPEDTAVIPSPAQESTAEVVATPAATPPPAAAAVQPAAAQNGSRPAPARRKLALTFNFSTESWVEVYDTRGTRLLYDVGQPGQSRTVEVEPPAQVVLGQANGVSTEINGTVVEVPAKRVSNQVAKFTVQPDGSVQ